MCFDFEFWFVKLQESMRHLSLFSVCVHFLRCYRRCDKFPKSKYCFYCFYFNKRKGLS